MTFRLATLYYFKYFTQLLYNWNGQLMTLLKIVTEKDDANNNYFKNYLIIWITNGTIKQVGLSVKPP